MPSFAEILAAAANEENTAPHTKQAVVAVGKTLQTFEFTRMSGLQWAEICAKCPARPDAPIDRRYGYNFQAAARIAAPLTGRRIVDDKPEVVAEDQWQVLWGLLSGHDVQVVCDTVWALNEWDPEQEVEALKKASRAASSKKRSSPAN